MVLLHIKLAFRALRKNPVFAVLNIGGWAVGLAACLAMGLFVRHEYGFDRFHRQADRIYRLNEVQRFDGMGEQRVALSMYPMAEALRAEFPAVEATARVHTLEDVALQTGEQMIAAETMLQVDSTFFRLFDFPVRYGDRQSALHRSDALVLTASTARRLFNAENVVGRIVGVYRDTAFAPFTVTAVLDDLPANSHLQFDALLPLHELQGRMESWMDGWDANWLVTYLLLRPGADPERLAAGFPAFEEQYLKTQAAQYDLFLQGLTDLHLGSSTITHDRLNHQKFDRSYVRLFGWLAGFILLLACFNFVNLSVANSTRRSLEVGIRKALGAGRRQLIGQFVGEAILEAYTALLLAALLVVIGLPWLRKQTGRSLSLAEFDPGFWLPAVLAVALVIGAVSGLYPAMLAAAQRPMRVLKGLAAASGRDRGVFRNVLVTMQFVVAIGMLTASLLVGRQLDFLRHRALGFDKDQVVVLQMNATANDHYTALRKALRESPYVRDVTAANRRLGGNLGQMGLDFQGPEGVQRLSVSQLAVDYNYLDFYQIKLLNGRPFDATRAGDFKNAYIINEAFARKTGSPQPIGAPCKVRWEPTWGTVIGVTEDFNFNSLHHAVAPLCLSVREWDFNELSVRIDGRYPAEALAAIEKQWKLLAPDMPFQYVFLDEHFDNLYRSERQVARVVRSGTVLALLIAALGLFGLALFVVQTRRREIGIRKVLGASVRHVVGLLTRDFLRLVVLANLLAIPLVYYFLRKWLDQFAYRIDFSWSIFLIAGSGAFLVAILAVGGQSLKAALANPVNSLSQE